MGIKRPIPPLKDWDAYIEQGKIKEMLLGSDSEVFMPNDGKSQSAIEYYRWFHDRWFIVGVIFKHFDANKNYSELSCVLEDAMQSILNEDVLVVLESLSSAVSYLSAKTSKKTEMNVEKIYQATHKIFKDIYKQVKEIPNDNFNLPTDYPFDLDKVKINIERKFATLDLLVKNGSAPPACPAEPD